MAFGEGGLFQCTAERGQLGCQARVNFEGPLFTEPSMGGGGGGKRIRGEEESCAMTESHQKSTVPTAAQNPP